MTNADWSWEVDGLGQSRHSTRASTDIPTAPPLSPNGLDQMKTAV